MHLLIILWALAGCGGGSDGDHMTPPAAATPTGTAPAPTPTRTPTPTPNIAAGALDPGFAGSGVVTVTRGTDVTVSRHGVAVLPDGRVLVAFLERTSGERTRVGFLTIAPDGTVADHGDPAFDLDVEAAAFSADGGILWAAGRSGGTRALRRFDSTLAVALAVDARLVLDPIGDLIPLAGGDMLAIGQIVDRVSGLQRLDVFGDLETGFGDAHGVVSGPRRQGDASTFLHSASEAPDGRILVAGTRSELLRTRSAGSAAGAGVLAADGALTSAGAAFVPDEPRRFDCGTSSGGVCQRLAPTVARLLANGTPDVRFGGTGTVVTDTTAPYGAQGTSYAAFALGPPGRITVAGTLCRAPFVCDVVVARYRDVD